MVLSDIVANPVVNHRATSPDRASTSAVSPDRVSARAASPTASLGESPGESPDAASLGESPDAASPGESPDAASPGESPDAASLDRAGVLQV
jgi:hypothetical protein